MPKAQKTQADSAKALLAEMNQALGDGAAMMLGNDPRLTVQYLSTGVLPIDFIFQGGIPRGRWTEIFGDYSTLKSFVAYRALATTQKAGGKVALVDTEHAYDPEWFTNLGGQPSKLHLMQPSYGEMAVTAIEKCLRSDMDMIVWDSIASTLPKTEYVKAPDDAIQPARLAAMMSTALRRLNAATGHTAVLCLNQTRTNAGMTFGSSETVPGGKALPFYCSYRLSLRKAGKVQEAYKAWDGEGWKDTKQTVGTKIKATLEKSKLSQPHREVWMTFDHRTGTVDDVGFLMGQALEKDLVIRTKSGWRWNEADAKFKSAAAFREELEGMEMQQWLVEQLRD